MRCLAALMVALPALVFGATPASAASVYHFDSMPVLWWYNPANEPPPPPGTTWEELITEAAQNWSDVPCAVVSFAYEGTTDAEWGKDGANVIYWPADWGFNSAAAGATLHIPVVDGEPREVDLALNGTHFTWTVGGGDAFQTDVLDAESVLTHELGHWLGLSHSPDQFATMYAAKLIGTMQATLDSDDKFRICREYPGGENECDTHADCAHLTPGVWECRADQDLRVCGQRLDPVGAHCSKDWLNCANMCFISFWNCSSICAFTDTEYTEGYCAGLCLNANGDEFACAPGYVCTDVPGYDIKACYAEVPAPDAGPEAGPESAPDAAEAGADVSSDVGGSDLTGLADEGCASASAGGGFGLGSGLLWLWVLWAAVGRTVWVRRRTFQGATA